MIRSTFEAIETSDGQGRYSRWRQSTTGWQMVPEVWRVSVVEVCRYGNRAERRTDEVEVVPLRCRHHPDARPALALRVQPSG